ncbi:MAG: hypothetical protein FD129_3122 [bacterium]|nr:MAG: hypothetical protein FD129_3122 [bacterium]
MRDGFSFSGESQRDSTSKHPALVVSKPLQGAAYVPLPPEGEVDLGREVINLTQAKHVYAATARVYSSIVETEKKGLDALA